MTAQPVSPPADPAAPMAPGPGAPPTDGAGPVHEVPLTRREERLLELVATVILALATLGTAWSGYQATRWNGVQASDYVTASGSRVEATKAMTTAGQDRLFDSQVFSQWLNALHAGDQVLATLYEHRFREEFRPAFEAWLATHPFTNADAPPGPLYMPEYVSEAARRSAELEDQAAAMFEVGQQANETSDQYVLNTVFLASALFLAGIAGRFEWRAARIAILVTSAIALGVGLVNIVRLPVQ
jgi:hypothetical protein